MHCFASIFTVFLLQKYVFSVYLTCKKENKWTVLYTWNALFCKCFHVFLLCFYWRNMYFLYITYVFKNTHVPYLIQKMHCFASVFMCFHCRNMYFWYISNVYKNKHVPYFIRERHCFASVFMCFSLFLLKKQVLLVYFACIQE
jgi:hypothetical protein